MPSLIHLPRVGDRPLIGRAEVALLKPGALIINTARGIIDEDALAGALAANHLGGAALDVLEMRTGGSGPLRCWNKRTPDPDAAQRRADWRSGDAHVGVGGAEYYRLFNECPNCRWSSTLKCWRSMR